MESISKKAACIKEFHRAVKKGDFGLVQKSLASGVDPNARGGDFSSALHTSVVYGSVEIVSLLLAQERIQLNLPDSRGRTPLWQAASNGHVDITRKLLETGQVDCRCKSYSSGRNVMWFAAYNGHVDIVHMLLKAGADPHEADDEGLTPISAAKGEGQSDVLKLFENYIK